ncbi:MAG: SCO family protein [Bacteroidota bacterium]
MAAVVLAASASVQARVVFQAPVLAQVTFPSDFRATDAEKVEGALPNRLEGQTLIDEQLGRRISRDLQFLNEQGETAELASLMDNEKPVVVAFVYHNCPMLCSLILDGAVEAMASTDLEVGQDYDLLAVSFDPNDTPARADSVKTRYLRSLGPDAAEGMHFWTVTPETEENVESLARQAGFGYAYDPVIGEYGHSAALIFLSPDGVVTRYLYGVVHEPRNFRLALVEAGQGTVGTTIDRFLMTCYQYDPDARGYAFYAPLALKLGGVLLLLVFGGLLARLWLREGQRQAIDNSAGDLPADPAL